MQYLKSPLNYIGGKYKLLPSILPHFPENIETFVDLFAGGGNVFINVKSNRTIVNDNLYPLINIFRFLKENPIEVVVFQLNETIEKFQLTKTNDLGYYNLRESYNDSPDSIKLLALVAFGFNHQIRFNNNHKFNNPFGKNRSSFNGSMEKNLIGFSKKLAMLNTVFRTNDFEDFDYSEISSKDFIYCDPPYLITSGTYNDGKRGFTGWSEKEEKSLYAILDSLNEKGVQFALSNVTEAKGLVNETLIEWSKSYKTIDLKANYNNSNYQRRHELRTKEVLIVNY